MNVSSVDVQDLLVYDYLAAVARAAADLPAVHRDELLSDLSEHIAVARSQCAPTEAGVRTILDRLGHPLAIADAARGFATGAAYGWAAAPRVVAPSGAAPPAAPDWSLAALWQRSPLVVVLIVVAVLGVLVLVAGFLAASVSVSPPVAQ